MSRLFYHVMQDNVGNLLFGVSGTMRLAGTGTAATIYGDEALTIPIANPMTNHPSFGSFKCFLGAGDYDFYMAKSGYTFETLTGVQGHGTMAQQDASAVAITGGTAAFGTVVIAGGTAVLSTLSVGGALPSDAYQYLRYPRQTHYGLKIQPADNDTGTGAPILFVNNASAAIVGSIYTTATTTAYNTTSDGRLKHAIIPLTGALDVVRALKPISHRWKADESLGVGFLAHEVGEIVDGVITGEKDAMDDEGNIEPQMIDYSKLVPYLVAAVKELTEQVEALTARLEACGG